MCEANYSQVRKNNNGSDNYTARQWLQGSASKCKACVEALRIAEPIRIKTCVTCKENKHQQEYSKTQWEKPIKTGSRCTACCEKCEILNQESVRSDAAKT